MDGAGVTWRQSSSLGASRDSRRGLVALTRSTLLASRPKRVDGAEIVTLVQEAAATSSSCQAAEPNPQVPSLILNRI